MTPQELSPLLVDKIPEMVVNFCVKAKIALRVIEQNCRMALQVAQRHYLMGVKGQITQTATTWELTEYHLSVTCYFCFLFYIKLVLNQNKPELLNMINHSQICCSKWIWKPVGLINMLCKVKLL